MSDATMNWHTTIINHLNANIPILLVGNKIDLIRHRVVPNYNVLELANEQKFIYTETSAKTGENADNLF